MPDDKIKQNQKPNNPINDFNEFKGKIHNYNVEKKKEMYDNFKEEFPVFKKLDEHKAAFIKHREQEKAEHHKAVMECKDTIHDTFINSFPIFEKLEKKIKENEKIDAKKIIVDSITDTIDDIKNGFNSFINSFNNSENTTNKQKYNQLDSLANKQRLQKHDEIKK